MGGDNKALIFAVLVLGFLGLTCCLAGGAYVFMAQPAAPPAPTADPNVPAVTPPAPGSPGWVPSPVPSPSPTAAAGDPLLGCWRRTDGGASECYTADGGYTGQREQGTITGTWHREGSDAMLLTLSNGTFRYTITWSGNDTVTFVGGGATETFTRISP